MTAKVFSPLMVGCMMVFGLTAAAQDTTRLEQRGKTLVERHCSRCHAIDITGSSTHPEAPPFRTLGTRYPIDSLAEALAEGLVTGHPDMPEFMFEVYDVGAILAYLQSIQHPPKSEPSNHR
jgi:mono/diheme cytochrome c family protein